VIYLHALAAEYNTLRVCFVFVMALFFGTAFWQMGERKSNRNDILTIAGAMFISCALHRTSLRLQVSAVLWHRRDVLCLTQALCTRATS
jgi:hypothetical protein